MFRASYDTAQVVLCRGGSSSEQELIMRCEALQ